MRKAPPWGMGGAWGMGPVIVAVDCRMWKAVQPAEPCNALSMARSVFLLLDGGGYLSDRRGNERSRSSLFGVGKVV